LEHATGGSTELAGREFCKFVAGLKFAFERRQLHLARELAPLTHPKFFNAWLRPLFRKDWIVYSKPPFGRPEYVLQYLGPLYPPRRHLQPSLARIGGRTGYLSLARLCRPQSAESDDPRAR
jgi:hypothetical protein